ncbi:SDR family NAD(P)-dependent oxidoreductase, partial [Streptomyces sp. NPDC050636]|uniref:SDR family NAD(P)-dependent oxidoreductase n=1 Tax=Streptomyces sp. NPDC050636 TaxID=3154510 RepID=UPI0034151394
VVVSGDEAAVDRVVEEWRERGCRVRRLRVSHAFHSPAMDPVLDELGSVAGELDYRRPELLWAGALAGDVLTECDSTYWPAQTRQAVRFADAVAALAEQGVSLFIEVGPDGSLSALGPDAVAGIGSDEGVFIPLQRRKEHAGQGVTGLVTGLARAFVNGATVDWSAVLPTGKRVELPTYAFRHERYWPSGVLTAPTAGPASGGEGASTAAEAQFWAAVEGGDLARIADTLALEDQRQLGDVLPALASWRRREMDRSVTANWRYRVSWAPVAEPDSRVLSGTWLVVVAPGQADDDLMRGCVQALAARGAEVLTMETTETADQERMAAQISAMLPEAGVSGVVSLLALDETPLPGHPELANGLAGTQTLVQSLIALGVHAPAWVLTRGAVAAAPSEAPTPVQAQTWGLARVAILEHPDHGGGLIDLPAEFDEQAAARLCAVLAGCGEDQVAIRRTGIFGRRLTRAAQPRENVQRWVPRGTVLITGGTGAIGGHVARWLVGRGAQRLVLTSRSGPGAADVAALAAELATAGAQVEVIASDAADDAALAGVIARIGDGGPPLTAVMHAAGLGQETALDEMSVEELASMLAAKAAGAASLDRLTAGLDLDAFVLFSSIAATWGSGMQGGYAAANSFLDALAENRLARGLAATSVAWGPWGGGGMTGVEGAAQMTRRGLRLIEPDQAIQALAQVLDGQEQLITVVDVDWARFAPPFTLRRPSPLIESLPEVNEALGAVENGNGPADTEAGSALARQLAGLSRAEQDRLLIDLVRAEAAVVLGHADVEAVEADRSFSDLGADSLTAVELRDRLTAATGLHLPSTLLFDYPTPAALADHLRACHTEETSAAQPVLAELDKLESMLVALTGNDESAQITNRLEVVLSKWKEARERIAESGVAEKLESSTDDEVFDFIGKELGIY